MPYAIEFEHISKSYTFEEVVLSDINLNIEDGQFVVLLGSSGCGKTTLLKMVNKLLAFDTGYLRIHGKKLSDWNIEELRRSIGYAIQQACFRIFVSGRISVTFPSCRVLGKRSARDVLLNWLTWWV